MKSDPFTQLDGDGRRCLLEIVEEALASRRPQIGKAWGSSRYSGLAFEIRTLESVREALLR